MGGGSPGQGKCTAEVVVDGSAEVVIRGDSATLRNLGGQQPQWRRFQCTGPLPANPADFRFAGVDGRGRQELVRDPRQGGSAVVRIDDLDGGSEGYTFDVFWGGGSGGGYNQGGYPPAYPGGRWGRSEAIAGCQDAVRQQAMQRYGGRRIEFLDGRVDDQPGRNDWIVGRLEVRGGGPPEQFQYSCSVDFGSGRVRSANLEPVGGPGYGNGRGPGQASSVAVDRCRAAAEDRMRRDGYRQVEVTSIHMDDRPGHADWVAGTARAYRGPSFESYDFSCSVDLRSGDVRSVDVRRR